MSIHSMNNPPWGPEDGELLQNLRINAGIDAFVFARSNTISAAQLHELESGEGRSFYSELIKRSTGNKLLKKLGYEFPDNAIQVTKPTSDALSATPAPEADSTVKPVVSSEVYKKPFTNPFVTQPLLMTGGLLTVVLWGFWVIQHLESPPTEIQRHAAPPLENAQPNGSASAPAATEPPIAVMPASAPEALPKTASLSPAEATTNSAPDRVQLASIACDDQHRKNSRPHTPSNPLKPGSYIYIEAKADSALCVLDSDNKLSLLNLKAGMNQTVNGLAPFLVHTSNWQGLQIFFQGRLVRTDLGDSAHLLLQSLPF
ncbi:hypothetical protein [Limnohabitans sp.]|uniref:hypothetical protein n=1 Tax=Limnohabitans sp. TaxID=1907725 RepID=UPI0039BCDFA7|nr:DUF4115 domain-containing protein [Comamonadaceae bacterium]